MQRFQPTAAVRLAFALARTYPAALANEDLKIGVIAAASGGRTAWELALERGVQIAPGEASAAGGATS
jgi:branched-chain amino acid transport system substrate-binding protein